MKNIALKETVTILIAIILGLAIGMIGKYFGFESILENWLSPIGFFFIKILKLIALPLIIVSIVSGIAQMKDITAFSKLGKKTIIAYLSTTVFAVSLGLVLANIIQAGNWLNQTEKEEIRAEASFTLEDKEEATASLNFILDLIPENIFSGLSNNQNMLQVLLLSILFGIAILYTHQKTQLRLADIFSDLNEVVMKVISFIMKLAPIGVLALMSDLIIKTSNPKMGIAIMGYALTVVLVLSILMFLFYPFLVKHFTGISRKEFNTSIRPAQLNGLATSSSAATLPITIKCLQENLNISKEVSSLVPTLGSSINMDGSAAYIAVAAIFVSQIFDIPLTFSDHLMILVGASVASIGAAAVPSGAIILMFTVFEMVGLPSEGIGLIIGLDRPLDLLRTACNVSGDCAVTTVVDKLVPGT